MYVQKNGVRRILLCDPLVVLIGLSLRYLWNVNSVVIFTLQRMAPALADQSLISGGNFAEAGYISICDGEEVNIYDGRTARIEVSEAAVLRGWRCSLERNFGGSPSKRMSRTSATKHSSLMALLVLNLSAPYTPCLPPLKC